LPLVGRFGYSLQSFDPDALAKELLAVHPDVLFVSAYVDDGVALRRATVRHHLPLLASIGTSSSYCMPAFGRRLGREAVGPFASDKPDGYALDPSGLLLDARALLAKAEAAYRARFGGEMSAPALAGFSNAWVLFRSVLPGATSLAPVAVGAAARAIRISAGGLPNGSGVQFGAPGTPGAGTNLRAASVIWEWVGLGREAVVWPPRFATTPVRLIAPVS